MPTLKERAAKAAASSAFKAETERIWRSDVAVRAVIEEATALAEQIEEQAAQMAEAAPSLGIEWARNETRVAIRSQRGSLEVLLRAPM